MERQFIATPPTPLPGPIHNAAPAARARIERAISQAIADYEAACTRPARLDTPDDFAALSASLNSALAKIAAHGPARSGPAGTTSGFRLPPGDDDSPARPAARRTTSGFQLPKGD